MNTVSCGQVLFIWDHMDTVSCGQVLFIIIINITSMALKSSEARAQKRNKTKSVIIVKSRGHTGVIISFKGPPTIWGAAFSPLANSPPAIIPAANGPPAKSPPRRRFAHPHLHICQLHSYLSLSSLLCCTDAPNVRSSLQFQYRPYQLGIVLYAAIFIIIFIFIVT